MESFRYTDAIALKDVSNFRFALCTFCIKEKQKKIINIAQWSVGV